MAAQLGKTRASEDSDHPTLSPANLGTNGLTSADNLMLSAAGSRRPSDAMAGGWGEVRPGRPVAAPSAGWTEGRQSLENYHSQREPVLTPDSISQFELFSVPASYTKKDSISQQVYKTILQFTAQAISIII